MPGTGSPEKARRPAARGCRGQRPPGRPFGPREGGRGPVGCGFRSPLGRRRARPGAPSAGGLARSLGARSGGDLGRAAALGLRTRRGATPRRTGVDRRVGQGFSPAAGRTRGLGRTARTLGGRLGAAATERTRRVGRLGLAGPSCSGGFAVRRPGACRALGAARAGGARRARSGAPRRARSLGRAFARRARAVLRCPCPARRPVGRASLGRACGASDPAPRPARAGPSAAAPRGGRAVLSERAAPSARAGRAPPSARAGRAAPSDLAGRAAPSGFRPLAGRASPSACGSRPSWSRRILGRTSSTMPGSSSFSRKGP